MILLRIKKKKLKWGKKKKKNVKKIKLKSLKWTSRENSLELIELSSVNKVSLV